MMSLFDEEEILKMYIRSERQEAAREAAEKASEEAAKKMAKKMLEDHVPYETIVKYISSLTIADLKKIEAEEFTQV